MTDSPIPGRHRNKDHSGDKERSGLIGPIVSALAVLLIIGPAAWLLTSQDGSTVADGHEDEKVLKVAEDNSGPAALDEPNELDDQPSDTPDVTTTPTSPSPSATKTPATARATPTPTRRSKPGTTTPARRTSTSPAQRATPTRTSSPDRSITTRRPQKPRPSTSTPTSTRPPAPPTGGGGTSAPEQQVLDLTNAQRKQHGCGSLSLDSSLVAAAGAHASDMVRRKYFDHTSLDGRSPFDRMQDAGFQGSMMGENIAVGYGSAKAVVDGWMKSEGHRKNILNCQYNRLGVGYDPGQVKSGWGNGSWVQNFGRN